MSTHSASYLHYRLRLRAPAIISQHSGDSNSSSTQQFITGSMIRGATAARILSTGNTDNAGDLLQSLVLSKQICYLNAYLEIDGARSYMVPLSWKRKKGETTSFYDLVTLDTDPSDGYLDEDDIRSQPLAAVTPMFAAPTGSAGQRTIAGPQMDMRLHQQRDRAKGRSWRDENDNQHGSIFAYEFLEPEQVFRGVIQVRGNAEEQAQRCEQIKRLLAGAITIGRSRRAGYGGEATLEFLPIAFREYENVSMLVMEDILPGQYFQALLTSPYIGRNPVTGQIDPTALLVELRSRLGMTVSVVSCYLSYEVQGGFNRKWRLPIPQAHSVTGGAVVLLRATERVPAEQLREIEHRGIGIRRVDGFGRLLFLRHYESSDPISLNLSNSDVMSEAKEPLSRTDKAIIGRLEQRIVLGAVHEELNRIAAIHLVVKATTIPSNSLIGRLRSLFRRVNDEPSAREALRRLNESCKNEVKGFKKPAIDKLKACRLGEQNLHQWLQAIADSIESDGWTSIARACGASTASTLATLPMRTYLTDVDSAKSILNNNASRLAVHLIDTVLAGIARSNQEGSR